MSEPIKWRTEIALIAGQASHLIGVSCMPDPMTGYYEGLPAPSA